MNSESLAERLLQGDAELAAHLSTSLLVPRRHNFVERPWGGTSLRRFKSLDLHEHDPAQADARIGEAFEIAAYDDDAEAARHPSVLRLADGSTITLSKLLARHGEALLGAQFLERYGACFPLLPKTLDIGELLSVQGHPQGHTEVYVVIEAAPGATIRLGFAEDIDETAFRAVLEAGLSRQRELLGRLAPGCDLERIQSVIAPWLAERAADAAAVGQALRGELADTRGWREASKLLEELKRVYWRVLDALNAVPVAAGSVVRNETPRRLLPDGRPPSAEVHALGNPERREILALEVRRPGPTFRAWDNVRFPAREVDVGAALEALNLQRTSAEDFVVEPVPVAGRPGVFRSVDGDQFHVEHLRPRAGANVAVGAEAPHSLHAIAGEATFTGADGRFVGRLARGQSALVPIGVGAYVVSAERSAEIVKAGLPLRA